MKIRLIWPVSVLFALLILMPGVATAKLKVFVSIPPQKYIVQQIGGDLVEIRVMVQPGASPHTYEPKPRQMVAIAQTDIYFAIGVEFETAWMRKISATNPAMKVVHMQEGIRKIPMAGHHHHEDEHDEHAHHHEDEHDEHDHHDHGTGLDPHIWLSPQLVRQLAANTLATLRNADPANASRYSKGYNRLIREIDLLDQELKGMFTNRQKTRFLVFHPSWGYFAEAYGLEQVAIEVEGKSPKPAQLKQIIKRMRSENIRVVFAQPQFSSRSAKAIAKAIKAEVVFIDPLAEDWMGNMRKVAENFRLALR